MAGPVTWTHSPLKLSDSTQTVAVGRSRRLRTLARSGYVAITMAPSGSTPMVTGESWGEPSDRVVASTAW